MAIISRLAVLLGLDAGEFNAGLGQAKQKVEGFSLGAKVSLATVALSFAATAKAALSFADQIADVAKANDMSIQSVLRMSEALTVNGGKAEDAGKLMASFNNKIDEAAQGGDKAQKAFQRIGISINDLKHLSPEKLFEKTIEKLGAVEDSTKRNALAMDMFGKAIKGVDIKGFADQLQQNKQAYADAEEAFKKVNQGFDNLAVLSQRIKTDTAKDIGDFFELVTRKALESYDAITKVIAAQKELAKNSHITPATVATPQGLIASLGLHYIDNAIKKVKDYKQEVASLTYKPIDTTLGPDFRTGKNATYNREIIAANADTLKKQNEALSQQVLMLNMQAKAVGQVASEYNKLNVEFEKGGKYDEIKNAKQIAEARAAALKLDIANKDEFLRKQTQEAQNAQEILRIEIEMAGASDTQRQKAVDLKKVDQEILDIKRKYPYATDEEIEAIRKLKMETVGLEETAKRVGNTFQAGWSNAFENWKERMTDSFGAGQQAFQTFASSMESALDNFVTTGKFKFGDLIKTMIAGLIRVQMQAQLSGIFKFLTGGSSSSSGGYTGGISLSSVISGMGIPGFADGGSYQANQPILVGERGPELMIPSGSGTIIPNGSVSSMMNNQPQIVYNAPYIANLNAIDTQSATQFIASNKQAIWAANQSAQRSLPQSR